MLKKKTDNSKKEWAKNTTGYHKTKRNTKPDAELH